MQIEIINESVQGASHKVTDKICQDNNKVEIYDNGVIIIAVADGHGSSACKLSHIGSEIATNIFCGVSKELLELLGSEEETLSFIASKGKDDIPKLICKKWKNSVTDSFNKLKEKDGEKFKEYDEVNFELYGTTLLGMIITPKFIYAMQIGDGDISFVSNNGVNHVIDPPKFLGTETYSLSNPEPWKNVVTHFQRLEYDEQAPCMFIMSSDGFSNSFVDDDQYKIACKDYFDTLNKYGSEEVQKNLKEWLEQTSEEGCGDDVTLVAIGFYRDIDRIPADAQDEDANEIENQSEVKPINDENNNESVNEEIIEEEPDNGEESLEEKTIDAVEEVIIQDEIESEESVETASDVTDETDTPEKVEVQD